MVIVLVMMTYILCLRAVLLMRERRYAKLSARWIPILLEGGARNPKPLPAVAPGERLLLLILWNTLRERNERDAEICHWMGRVAAVTKIDRLARRLLRRRSVRKKHLGLVTLGQLRDRLEWPRLCQLAQSEHPLLSLPVVWGRWADGRIRRNWRRCSPTESGGCATALRRPSSASRRGTISACATSTAPSGIATRETS